MNKSYATKTIIEENENVCPLTLNDLILSLRLPVGTKVTKYISCDSNYILDVMPRIRSTIHQNMPWVPRDEIMYHFVGNAGGHGTEAAIHASSSMISGDQPTCLGALAEHTIMGRRKA
jgi:hypothetical protein